MALGRVCSRGGEHLPARRRRRTAIEFFVDRLWPRGVSKQRAKLDEWEKELPPSTELREWFGHEPSRFPEFRRRYITELRRERPRLTLAGSLPTAAAEAAARALG
jgi:uncharacterized protein YeaO (DUF488 family)